MEKIMNKPLLTATLGEFIEAIKIAKSEAENKPRALVYGIAGLAAILNCSVPTAQKLKNSGQIPYMQKGRKIVFDVESVLSAIEQE